ncbi:hypothetical protein U27_00131 [Candidatus Vecturithrix granuli]|uniref:Protein-glutamine gamma-glutamyltransferase-like C-terminal domain-containing protein n=1 Tax=Vecturithrix granuli TaxID=1499967 RepID=A0A081C6N5_VECG1|nr:hypothetical protein U27_00131 [Candidatus Vecturithrix granuli]
MFSEKVVQLRQLLLFKRGQAVGVLACLWLLAMLLPGLPVADTSAPVMQTTRMTPGAPSSEFAPVSLQTGRYVLLIMLTLCLAAFIAIVWKVQRRMQRDQEMIYVEHAKNPWQGLLVLALMGVLIGLVVWWVWRHPVRFEDRVPTGFTAFMPIESPAPAETPPTATDELPPQMHRIFVLGSVIGGILLVSVVGWLAWSVSNSFRSRSADLMDAEAYDVASLSARGFSDQACDSESEDVTPSVLRCYRDLCRLFSNKVAIRRAMTTREFLRELQRVGIHDQEALTLTTLFEHLRYGHYIISDRQARQAQAAMQALYARYGRDEHDDV